jgi:FdhE protein
MGSGIEAELKRYRDKDPELAQVLDFYKEIFEIQKSARDKIGPTSLLDDATAKLESGRFILEGSHPAIDYGVFKEAALKLSGAFSKMAGQEFPVEELLALPQLQEENIDSLAGDVLNNRIGYIMDFAEGSGFNAETVFHFLHQLLIPFFQAAAEGYADTIEKAAWQQGNCPYCGSQPRYARFHLSDGRRLLYCPLCHSQWRFPRLCCPFCGNDDQQKLKHAHIGNDEAHRIDVCEVCRRYLKTTDERQLGHEVIPQVEDVATMALDYLAEREGYHREA